MNTASVRQYADADGTGHSLDDFQGHTLALHLRSTAHRVWYTPDPAAEHARLHALMDAHAAGSFGTGAIPMTQVRDPREFFRLSGPLPGLDDILAATPALLRPSYRTWDKAQAQFYGVIGAPHTHNVYWRSGVLRRFPQAARSDATAALASIRRSI